MTDTVKDSSTPTAVTVSDRMREQRLIKDPFDFVAQLATECGFSIQQWELSDTVKLTGLYRHVVKRVLTHHDPAEERLDCQTCDGSGQIEVGTERPHDGGEVSVYDDCPDCADKPASLPQTLGEERVLSNEMTELYLHAVSVPGKPVNWAAKHKFLDAVATLEAERSRLLTALEEKEKQAGHWEYLALDYYEKLQSLESDSVLQKEELERAKATIAALTRIQADGMASKRSKFEAPPL